jgi:putative restriction endonuclease
MSALPKSRPVPKPVPPLEAGDHLSREEFERRYHAMPEVKNAQLIEGEVHMPSPVRWPEHAYPHSRVITWLSVYDDSTPGVQTGDNGTIRMDLDNLPQPDAAAIILASHGGQATIGADGYVTGAPELAAEIAASSASIDLHQKLRVYRRNKVREYIVWRVQDAEIDWFTLRDSQYEKLPADDAGIIRSEVFPGLWLDVPAMIRFDLAKVLQVLQQGLASPEHAAFVQKLAPTAKA